MEHKAFLSIWCRTYAHKGEGFFLPGCFEAFVRTNSTRRTLPCDVCEISHVFRESRCFENNVCTCILTHLFLLDDGVIFGKNIVFVLDLMTIFFVSLFSPSFVTMLSSKPLVVCRMNRWTRNSAQRLENYDCEALVFSRHNIDLVFDEENMEPERLTETLEDAACEDHDSHLSSSSRVSDVLSGTNRTRYQERVVYRK